MRSFLCWVGYGPDPSEWEFPVRFRFLPMRRRYGVLTRRGVLQGGGAGFVSALALFMIGAGRTARADPLAAVTTVDRLTIRMVVDNGLTPFAPPGPLDGLKVKRAGLDTAPDRPPRRGLLLRRNGVSPCTRSPARRRNAQCSRRFRIHARRRCSIICRSLASIRLDIRRPGAEPRPFRPLRRHDRLSRRPTRSKLKEERPAAVPRRRGLLLRSRGGCRGGQFGALDRDAIADAGLTLMMAEEPALVADHAFATGSNSGSLSAARRRSNRPTRKSASPAGFGCFAGSHACGQGNVGAYHS